MPLREGLAQSSLTSNGAKATQALSPKPEANQRPV